MANNDICVLRLVGRYQSQNIVNTFHYRIVNQISTDLEVLEKLTLAWDSIIRNLWVARCIDSYTAVGLKAFRVTGTAKTPHYRVLNHAGTITGTEVPSNICRLITLYTTSSNHRRRGRVMMSGCATSMFDTADGSITNTEVAAMQSLGESMEAVLDAMEDTFQLCIPPSGTDPYEDIVDVLARSTPGAISSRRVRRFFVG